MDLKKSYERFKINCKYVFKMFILPKLKSIKTSIDIIIEHVGLIYQNIKSFFLIKSIIRKAKKISDLERKALIVYNVLDEIKKLL